MPERIPLVYNSNSGGIQEVSSTDEVNVGILTATVFSNPNTITSAVSFANSAFNYMQVGPVTVGAAGTITVGAGVSYLVI
tara:strand:- start:214 stop:453 length:240 start_codon:yes stop_codon:yes gene_type:complete